MRKNTFQAEESSGTNTLRWEYTQNIFREWCLDLLARKQKCVNLLGLTYVKFSFTKCICLADVRSYFKARKASKDQVRSFKCPTQKCTPGQLGTNEGLQQEVDRVTLWPGRDLLEAK